MSIVADHHSHQSSPVPAVDVHLRDRLETLQQLEREAKAEQVAAHERWAAAHEAERVANQRLQHAGAQLQGIRQAVTALEAMLPDHIWDHADLIADSGWQVAS